MTFKVIEGGRKSGEPRTQVADIAKNIAILEEAALPLLKLCDFRRDFIGEMMMNQLELIQSAALQGALLEWTLRGGRGEKLSELCGLTGR